MITTHLIVPESEHRQIVPALGLRAAFVASRVAHPEGGSLLRVMHMCILERCITGMLGTDQSGGSSRTDVVTAQ